MNSKTNNNYYNNQDDIQFHNNKGNTIKFENLVPSTQYQSIDEEKQAKLQFFPIVTNDTSDGKHTIYLATQSNDNLTDYIQNNEYKYSFDKNNIKPSNHKNIFLIPQSCIQIKINDSKFEYLLKCPLNNQNENNIIKNNNNLMEENQIKFDKMNDIKEEKLKNKEKINYNNIKKNFISTTQKLYNTKRNDKNKNLFHSYSVENYSDILNSSFSSLKDNLDDLENSKIMKSNFIKGIKNTKRKNNLLKAIEKYRRIKSLGKNNNDILNNSFTFGFEKKKKTKKY